MCRSDLGHPLLVVEAGATIAGPTFWQLASTLSARRARSPLTLEVTPTTREDQMVRVRVTGRLDRAGLGTKVPTFVVGRYLDLEVEALFEPA